MEILSNVSSVRICRIRVVRSLVLALLLGAQVMYGTQVMPVMSDTNAAKPSDTRAGFLTPVDLHPARITQPTLNQADIQKPHLLAGSYYSLLSNLTGTVVLNNKGPDSLEVIPTLFDLSGNRFEVPAVTVEGNSFQVFDLSQWAALGGATFQQGSLQLFYRGKDLMLGAQIKLVDPDSSLIFDEQLVEPAAMFSSSRLEGVWFLPTPLCQFSLVLSNTTDAALSVAIAIDSGTPTPKEPAQLTLQAHQTQVLDLQQEMSKSAELLGEVGGVSIEHSGPKGSLLARGMIEDPRIGYSSSLQFTDPLMTRSSRLHGAGLRLGRINDDELTPVILVRNIGSGPTVISGRIPFTSDRDRKDVLPLKKVRLAAGKAKVLKMDDTISRKMRRHTFSAGLEFEYTTKPGTVIMSALSMSRSGNQVFQVPMLDPDAQKSSTGGYPWSIKASSSTVVYVKNVTNKPQEYVAYLNSTGGEYMIGLKTIEPKQTAVIDIRTLRDNQITDEEGRTIPPDATSGQFKWSLIEPEPSERLALIGRAEQIDPERAITSSYACQNCCTSNLYDAFVLPSPAQIQVNNSVRFYAYQRNLDCYGGTYTFNPSGVAWSSNNGNIATIDHDSGNATGVGPGEVTITASWYTTQYMDPPQPCGGPYKPNAPDRPDPCSCTSFPIHIERTATLQVKPGVSSLGVSMPSTKNPVTGQAPPADSVAVTNTFTAFASDTSSDLIAIFQSSTVLLSVTATGVTPPSAASQLRWRVDRDPSDTVAAGAPTLSATTGAQVNVTPSIAGNFRLICFFDTNASSAYDAGEELRVLRFAVVRATLVTGATVTSIDGGGLNYAGAAQGAGDFAVISQSNPALMLIQCRVLLEGGGSNRRIGIDKMHLGVVGNLTSDTSKVNYGASGLGTETPNQSLPMVDSPDDPSGAETAFRSNSQFGMTNVSGGGKHANVAGDDDPDVGPFKIVHPSNGLIWTSTQGGYDFREYIVGYSNSFTKYYVVFAKANWSVRVNGSNNGGNWVNNGSTLTLQGSTTRPQNLTNAITNNSPQSGDDAGIQLLGKTYAKQTNRPFIYTP